MGLIVMTASGNDFFGFLIGQDVELVKIATEYFNEEAQSEIYPNDTTQAVVEEVILRDGEFFTGLEAKEIAPWEIQHTNLCFARFKYLDNEERPIESGWADYDWVALSPLQHRYGIYLQEALAAGKIVITSSRTLALSSDENK